MAFACECDDALPSSLPDLPERLEWTNRSAVAELLGKLAPRDLLWSIRGIDFALRNRPGAIVLLAPERTAGMNEQNFEPASARMPALKVDLLEVLFSAAISLLFCGADPMLSNGGRSEERRLPTCATTNVRNRLVAQQAPDTPRRTRLSAIRPP